ncbi:MAG: acyl-CoA thioesterase [Thermoleophilia bacterium]|nr:acyl-CoA thioesterase [Thermoleophilia bacterium]
MLEEYPVRVEIDVRWADMDALGHVNHTMYLQYFEIARIEYLMRLGIQPPSQQWGEYGFILAGVTCRFLAPVTFPDRLSVGARIVRLGEDRALMEHAAHSHKLDRLVAVGDATVVAYDYVNRTRTSLREQTRALIRALEQKEIRAFEDCSAAGGFPSHKATG